MADKNKPGTISFTVLNSDFKLKNRTNIRKALKSFIIHKNKISGDISFIFCDDMYLADMNQKYLQHDTFTDIITFDYSSDRSISGDIFISTDRVIENAGKFNVPTERELMRVMAHGILHLMGFTDEKPSERLAMTNEEDLALNYFNEYL
jgi:probable rRNA maturation factor